VATVNTSGAPDSENDSDDTDTTDDSERVDDDDSDDDDDNEPFERLWQLHAPSDHAVRVRLSCVPWR
jgi:hypothetical protein